MFDLDKLNFHKYKNHKGCPHIFGQPLIYDIVLNLTPIKDER